MKAGKVIAVSVVAMVAVAVLVTLLTKSEPEPEFKGRPLSYWLVHNFVNYPRRNPEAIHALREMGQPAVKRLTEMVEREDSFLRMQIVKHGDKLSVLNENLPIRYWERYYAALALGSIGTNAASAIPVLEKMAAGDDHDLARAGRAALVLVRNESIRELTAKYLDRSNATNFGDAYGIILQLGPYAEEAIPVLLKEMQSTNNRTRLMAMTLLENVCVESELCVPVMTNLLSDSNPLIRCSAADALANSGRLAKDAAPLVVRLLDDQDYLCRCSALGFLYSVASSNEFAPYQARISLMTNDSNELVRDWAKKVLREKAN